MKIREVDKTIHVECELVEYISLALHFNQQLHQDYPSFIIRCSHLEEIELDYLNSKLLKDEKDVKIDRITTLVVWEKETCQV